MGDATLHTSQAVKTRLVFSLAVTLLFSSASIPPFSRFLPPQGIVFIEQQLEQGLLTKKSKGLNWSCIRKKVILCVRVVCTLRRLRLSTRYFIRQEEVGNILSSSMLVGVKKCQVFGYCQSTVSTNSLVSIWKLRRYTAIPLFQEQDLNLCSPVFVVVELNQQRIVALKIAVLEQDLNLKAWSHCSNNEKDNNSDAKRTHSIGWMSVCVFCEEQFNQ